LKGEHATKISLHDKTVRFKTLYMQLHIFAKQICDIKTEVGDLSRAEESSVQKHHPEISFAHLIKLMF
jgi:hypothetical protein